MTLPLIAGNWKMHTTQMEARALAQQLAKTVGVDRDVEAVLIPPFVYLAAVREAIQATSLRLGAQDVHWESKGAFTGEVSAPMLKDVGCHYVVVGHSERRHGLHESLDEVSKKFRAVMTHGLVPILCVGEILEERDAGKTLNVIERQVTSAFEGAEPKDEFVIAYEPVWAIGTGRTATPAQAQEIHAFIRSLLKKRLDARADQIRILYGGSVKPENIDDLMAQQDINGALVGGASLDAAAFARIVRHRRK